MRGGIRADDDGGLVGLRRGDVAADAVRRAGRRAADGHHPAPAEGEARPAAPGRAAHGQRPDPEEGLGGGQGGGGAGGAGGGRWSRRRSPLGRERQFRDFGPALKTPGRGAFHFHTVPGS